MKNKVLLILLLYNFCYSQNKENVYFLYNKETTDIKLNSVIKIDNQHFKIIQNDFKIVYYKNIKSKLITFDNFVRKNQKKKFPDYYDEYNIYIYIPSNKQKGKCYKAEKIWIIDEPIE